MKFLNTNGIYYTLTLSEYRKERTNASKPAVEARKLLHNIFSCDQILEEVPIKIGKTTLYLDFLIPSRQLIVEVNGGQHRIFSVFHHADQHGFLLAKKRDADKRRWCELNNLNLVVLNDDRQDEWRELISQRGSDELREDTE